MKPSGVEDEGHLILGRLVSLTAFKVMALSAMVLLGGLPIGAPLVGWVADVAGPRTGVAVGSLAALLAGVVVMRHVALHDREPSPAARGALPRAG
jgi:hypothetical protein